MLLALLLIVLSQPLSGPAVRPAPARPSIVEIDFTGKLRRPETTPERAALALLSLDDPTRAAINSLLSEREARLDAFVTDHLLLLGRFDTAIKGGSQREAVLLGLALIQGLQPVLQLGPPRDAITAALPAPARANFLALLRNYDSALVREARAARNDAPRALVLFGERLRALGEEIGRSFQRQLAAGTLFADALLAGVNLSPDQARTFRDMKLDLLERLNGHATEEDQRDLVVGILARLSESQRAIVIPRIPR
ncbi:MAG: hypothetical protein ACKVW3_02145 [Phycisphaerales bacterium]